MDALNALLHGFGVALQPMNLLWGFIGVTLGTFVGVLWVLSSGISIPIGGGDSVIIPGYMVWAALLYAGAGSWLAWWIGRPLIGLHVRRYETEAEFRFALVRVSESAEAVALYGGEKDERRYIDKTFANVLTAMRRVVFALMSLSTTPLKRSSLDVISASSWNVRS